MTTIHGGSHAAIQFFHKHPAALAVYWIYCSRVNKDNVAYPALRGLAKSTGWSINPVRDARAWLVNCGALERVEGYIRPEWRKLPQEQRDQRLNMDQSEYYRPTGIIIVDSKVYDLLYIPSSTFSEIDEPPAHVSPHDTSGSAHVSPDDISLRDTELDSISLLLLEDVGAIYKVYESEIGMITPMVRDEIKDALSLYAPEWIKDALKEASLNNKRNWKYALAILKRWAAQGRDSKPQQQTSPQSQQPAPQATNEPAELEPSFTPNEAKAAFAALRADLNAQKGGE